MSKYTEARKAFQALIDRLESEDRMFQMDDDIEEFEMFSEEEMEEFGAIIDFAREQLSDDEFDAIAYGVEDEE